MSIDDADVMSPGIEHLQNFINTPAKRRDQWPVEAVAVFAMPRGPAIIQQMVWKPGILCRQIVVHDDATRAPMLAAVVHLPFNEAGLDYCTGLAIDGYYILWSPRLGRAYLSTTPPKDMAGVCARRWVEVRIDVR